MGETVSILCCNSLCKSFGDIISLLAILLIAPSLEIGRGLKHQKISMLKSLNLRRYTMMDVELARCGTSCKRVADETFPDTIEYTPSGKVCSYLSINSAISFINS